MRLTLGIPFINSLTNSAFSTHATKISLKSPSELFQTTITMSSSSERIPNDVANISLWLDPSVSSSTISNGASVSTYTDRIYSNQTFTMSGSNRPTYSTTAINGKPGLAFASASSQNLQLTGTQHAFTGSNTQCVIFAVINVTSIGSNASTIYLNAAVFADSDFGYRGIFLRSIPTVGAYWYGTSPGDVNDAEASISLSTSMLVTYIANAGVLSCQVNNLTPTTVSILGGSSSNQPPLQIGKGPGAYLNGAIGDIIVLESYNVNDVNDIQQYLRTKYSLW